MRKMEVRSSSIASKSQKDAAVDAAVEGVHKIEVPSCMRGAECLHRLNNSRLSARRSLMPATRMSLPASIPKIMHV